MKRTVSDYIHAGHPVLYLHTAEQERAFSGVLADLKDSGLDEDLTVHTWKSTTGLKIVGTAPDDVIATTLPSALQWMAGGIDGTPPRDNLYVMFNPTRMIDSPRTLQQFRDTAYALRTARSHIVCIGGAYEPPEELDDMITFVDFDMPCKGELRSIVESLVDKYKSVAAESGVKISVSERDIDLAAENVQGMTALKAEGAACLSLTCMNGIDIGILRDEKKNAVKKSSALEYIVHDESMDTLGGFDVLKFDVGRKARFYREPEEARKFGLDPPKGVIVIGLAGTGKTLCGKAIAATLGLPLYTYNLGAVFDKHVGGSEEKVRSAVKTAEALAPCVLLFDEFEKMVAGLESSGKTDSGVASRVMSYMLTWMAECKKPIFKIATCNTMRNLDPAMIRRGRWDGVYGVGLPTWDERKSIFSIHIAKRGRDPRKYDLDSLADKSVDFVGAEIEAAVVESLFDAFDREEDLLQEHIEAACADIVPLSKTEPEEMAAFRTLIGKRLKNVSSASAPKKATEKKMRVKKAH